MDIATNAGYLYTTDVKLLFIRSAGINISHLIEQFRVHFSDDVIITHVA